MYVKANGSELIKFPYTLQELKADNPNVSFPRSYPAEVLAEYGVYPVASVEVPSFDEATQTIESGDVYYEDGWKLGWSVVELTAEQIAARSE